MSPAACRKNKGLPWEQSAPDSCRGAASTQEGKGSDAIVDRYLAGNLHERLNMWLTHRDLRPTLSRLDKAMYEE